LTLDLWTVSDGRCQSGSWFKDVFMQGHGGNGSYSYFWNGVKQGGPTGNSITFEVQGSDGPIIGKGRVESGDGQVVETNLFVTAVNCTSP
jgi:hypothetical protein